MKINGYVIGGGLMLFSLLTLVASEKTGLVVNIAAQALAIPSNYPNPINDGKPIVFGRKPEFADDRPQTGYRLVCDQPGRFEFYFDPAHPVSPGRCEMLTQMEKVIGAHVEILRAGAWVTVAKFSGDWTVAADWTPEPTVAVAVVIDQVTDLDHEPARVMEIRLLASENAIVSLEEPKIALSTQHEFNVFTLGEEVQVSGKLIGADRPGRPSTWLWRWDDFVNNPIDPGGREVFAAGTPAIFHLKPAEQGPLLLKVSLRDDQTGAIIASAVLLVGVRDPGFPGNVRPLHAGVVRPLPTRKEITGKMIWGAELYHRMLSAQFKAGEAPLEAFQQGGLNLVAAYQDVAWFEPLPGVFNFAGLDSVVQGAEAHGLGVELGLWRWTYGSPGLDGPGNLQYWLEPDSAVRRDGTKGPRWLNMPSLSSADYRASALRATEVFIRRYREHPSVWIWHLHPFGIVDHDFTSAAGEREGPLDYSVFARKAFHEFLAGKYRGIAQLNAKYHTNWTDFSAVPLPEPAVKGTGDVAKAVRLFDNRPMWRDYLAFRDTRTVHRFQKELYARLRELDPERPIGGMSNTMANSAVPEEVAMRRDFGAYYGDQNTETPAFIRRYLGSDRGRLPFRGEDHSPITPRRFAGDLPGRMNEFFFNCAASGVHQLNYVFPVWEENPAWTMFASPALREAFAFNAATATTASSVGLLHSFTTGALEGFASYAFIELHRWLDLVAWSGVMMTPGLWTEPVLVDAKNPDFEGKTLLIDNDSRLLEPAAVQALVRFVNGGGNLVLQRTSGQFETDREQPTWRLLRALGYPDLDGLAVSFASEATVSGEGMLAGLSIPLLDVAEVKFPGAGAVARLDGKVVVATWNRGLGHVLLLGGTVGDSSLVESRRRLLGNESGAMTSFPKLLHQRTEWLCDLTLRLQRWAKTGAQGIRCDEPVWVVLRRAENRVSIALLNPGAAILPTVNLRIPVATMAHHARVTYPGRVESLPVKTGSNEATVELSGLKPRAFCLIQFTIDGADLPLSVVSQ
jgi:hypothetical protein